MSIFALILAASLLGFADTLKYNAGGKLMYNAIGKLVYTCIVGCPEACPTDCDACQSLLYLTDGTDLVSQMWCMRKITFTGMSPNEDDCQWRSRYEPIGSYISGSIGAQNCRFRIACDVASGEFDTINCWVLYTNDTINPGRETVCCNPDDCGNCSTTPCPPVQSGSWPTFDDSDCHGTWVNGGNLGNARLWSTEPHAGSEFTCPDESEFYPP